MKRATVVIPSFNHARFLPKAVESVLRQEGVGLELVVVDDGSSDGSLDYLRTVRDARFRLVEQRNAGAHAAINRGLQLAQGDVLAILNSDDVFHPRRIAACMHALEERGCDLVATWLEVIDDAGQVLGVKEGWHNMLPWPVPEDAAVPGLDSFEGHLMLSNFVSTTSNMVFTRRLYERIGGMRNLRFAHDWDFTLRAAAEFRCFLLEHPLLQYRLHGSNTISSNRGWMLFEICWVFATALRRLQGRGVFADGATPQLARDARFLAQSINLQGNDKVLWMIDRFISARTAAGDECPEERLLDDQPLRDAFIQFVVA